MNLKSPAPWPPAEDSHLEFATFAGGCFWSVELAFQRVPGVAHTCVGYTAGKVDNPTYEAVCSGQTGHTEAVQVSFDPKEVSYETLCGVLFGKIDHTALNRAGNDVGTQYRSGIYTHSPEQQAVAEGVNAKFAGSVVEVVPIQKFWPAEVYHQQYLEKGGNWGKKQSASKGCTDPIRCYG